MKEFLSNFIEKIFHPLLMPFYALILPFFYADVYFVNSSQSFRFFLLIATSTFILPALSELFLRMVNGKWFHLSERALHLIPYVVSVVLSLYLIYFFIQVRIPFWFVSLLFASTVVVLATAIISYYWNISIVLFGLGGLLGSMMGVCYFAKGANPFMLFIFIFILSGAIGSLQLAFEKHTKAQVYVGFLGGWLLAFISVILSFYIYFLVR